jgi:hypothetical protein
MSITFQDYTLATALRPMRGRARRDPEVEDLDIIKDEDADRGFSPWS